MSVLATPSKFILYAGNTQVLQILGLQDYLSQTYLNSAAITGTLQDDQGNDVPECTDIAFTYVPGSNGDYNGVFGDQNFQPAIGTGYTLLIDGNENGEYIHLEL